MKNNEMIKNQTENLGNEIGSFKNQTSSFKNQRESFDLLVTFKEDLNGIAPEIRGIEEIELGLSNSSSYFYIKESEFFNAVTVDLYMDTSQAVQKLAQTPTEAIEKAVPIDVVVPSITDNIIKATLEIAAVKIAKEESFTVKCEFRSRYSEPLDEVINKVHGEVCGKLDLEYTDKNPDWIILIEELGKNTGIAIRRPDEILIK
jgi:tRNA acetyltransferase TAN1